MRVFSFHSIKRVALPVLAAITVAGCAGYHLGPSNGEIAGSKTIEIRPFVNLTIEPRVTEYVSNSLRKEVQRDGTYKLETQGAGDILVTGTISRFERFELAYSPTDVLTPRDYNLVLAADVVAVDRSTGKTNFAGRVTGRTAIRIGNDLGNSERQAIPLLAEDLARNVVSRLADGTW